jgi:hypothetical protein
VFLALWIFTIVITSCLVILKKSRLADVRQLINQTATGRAVTTAAFPNLCEGQVSTKEWVRTAGKEMIVVKYKADGKILESSESAPSTGAEGGAERTTGNAIAKA